MRLSNEAISRWEDRNKVEEEAKYKQSERRWYTKEGPNA